MDLLVNPPLGNPDHFSVSFSVKMDFKIPDTSFSRKVYLKSSFDWPLIGDDLFNHNWNLVYNSQSPISEVNKVTTFLIDRFVPSKIIRQKMNDKA